MNYKKIKYKFSEDIIVELKEAMGWRGEGTRDSPLIIENLHEFAEISLRTKSIYLVLRRQTITKLSIIDSENVKIEDCIINDLEITSCRNLKFIRNHIDSVKQLLCRGCYFEHNGYSGGNSGDVYSRLINNTYERRTFVFVWVCLVVGILFGLIGTMSLVYLYISLDAIIISIAGISLLITMIYMLYMRFRLNKVPENQFTPRFPLEEPVKEEINV